MTVDLEGLALLGAQPHEADAELALRNPVDGRADRHR